MLFTGAAPLPPPIDGGHGASKKKMSNEKESMPSLSPRGRQPVPDLGQSLAYAFTRAGSAGSLPCKSWPDDCEKCFDFTKSFSTTPGPPSTHRRLSDEQPRRVQLPSEQFACRPSHSTSLHSPTSRKKRISSGTAFYSRVVAQQAQDVCIAREARERGGA